MIGADIAAALPELRAHAESLMVDECVIERRTGRVTVDPNTLEESPEWVTVLESPCRVQRARSEATAEPVVGEYEFATAQVTIQLPISVTQARRHDRVTITSAAIDPAGVGRAYTVLRDATKTHATMRRLVCEEVDDGR